MPKNTSKLNEKQNPIVHGSFYKKAHIAILLPSLAGGGAERSMLVLAATLADLQYRVDLLIASRQGQYSNDIASNVNVFDLGARRVHKAFLPLAKYLIKHRPGTLISTMDHANIIAIFASRLFSQKTCVVSRISCNHTGSLKHYNSLKRRVMLRITPFVYHMSNLVVCPSYGVAEDIVTNFGFLKDKIQVIYTPVYRSELKLDAEAPIYHPWLIGEQFKVVLAVGRLAPEKDFETLIRAFSLAAKHRSSLRLIILGEGPERTKLERLSHELGIGRKLDMPGFVTNPYAYMSRANLFVLSSTYEGMPVALVEALCLGTPVVSTDCPSGPAEILAGGTYGRLCPVGDSEAIAAAILSTLQCNSASEDGMRHARSLFSADMSARTLIRAISGA